MWVAREGNPFVLEYGSRFAVAYRRHVGERRSKLGELRVRQSSCGYKLAAGDELPALGGPQEGLECCGVCSMQSADDALANLATTPRRIAE